MPPATLAVELIFVLLAAFLGGIIAKILKLPLLVGYLLGGVLSGGFLSRFIPPGGTMAQIAEVGVALLLFTLGLEFSLAKMKELGEVIIFGSFIQIVLTILVSIIIFPLFGLDFYTALFLGAVFSLSSTAVVVKTLTENGELDTLHGRMASGWLFMQDLYTLPLMIILPAIGKTIKGGSFETASPVYLGINIILAVIIFFAVLIIGKKIIPFIIDRVADLKSRELILICAVLICLIFSFIFQFFGFSFAIGAFIAGVLIGSSSAKHGIFAEIRPLRDIFSVVFFVSLGFMIDPKFIFDSWQFILLLVVFIMCLKLVISALIIFFMGYHTKIAALVGVSLVSIGEFAFILAITAVSAKLIDEKTYMTILSVTFMTLVFSVPILSVSNKLYYLIKKNIFKKLPSLAKFFVRYDRLIPSEVENMKDHVVVLGHGRVGRYICRALSFVEIPYLVVDYNHQIVRKLREEGINVIYGDPVEIDVLRFANLDKAKIVIIAYSDRTMQESIISNIMLLNPNIKLICRTHFEEDQKKLKSLGVETVVQPEFEAAVSMTEKLLKLFNIPAEEIEGKITRLKIEHGLG
ncbi:cation:proton antiporter [Candidatus Microgenomates bacterium]|nr:cation:proton antiporter [Candidatus Microgenomates bacterium]